MIDLGAIGAMLEAGQRASPDQIRDVLHCARGLKGLEPAQVALLIQVADPSLRAEVAETARLVHEKVYGRRIGLVAPVCPTNRCINDCAYCPLRRSNARLRRHTETARDLQREVVALLDEGYRHVNLVFGEDRSGAHYVRDCIVATYGSRSGLRQVQRVDFNINPMTAEEWALVKEAGRLGTYHLFQETYHPKAYAALHPDGPKADYAARLRSVDGAIQAGIVDFGLGILLGAYDFCFDVTALVAHAGYLEATFGRAPRAFTLPRMIPSPGAPASQEPERVVSDEDFRLIVSVIRLARPFADIVLCTPVTRDVRRELYALGISQVSVGSGSYPGVYTADGDPEAAGALTIGRPRALEELVYRMCEAGFVPNFWVACSTPHRCADGPQPAVSESSLSERCAANALIALREYLMDYASADTRTVGERLIQGELARLPDKLRAATLELMEEAEAGLRGLSLS